MGSYWIFSSRPFSIKFSCSSRTSASLIGSEGSISAFKSRFLSKFLLSKSCGELCLWKARAFTNYIFSFFWPPTPLTTDTQRGNSFHCMAENSIPLPNFQVRPKHICLPYRPNFSDIFDLCLHWVSVVRDLPHYLLNVRKKSNFWITYTPLLVNVVCERSQIEPEI